MPASSAEKQAPKKTDEAATSLKAAYQARQAAARPLPKSLRRAYEQLIARSEAGDCPTALH